MYWIVLAGIFVLASVCLILTKFGSENMTLQLFILIFDMNMVEAALFQFCNSIQVFCYNNIFN